MKDLIDAVAKTPLPTILVIAGVVFLFLAVGGQLGARFSTKGLQRAYAAGLGLFLLAVGIFLQLGASKETPAEPKPAKSEQSATPAPTATPSGPPGYALRGALQVGQVFRSDWVQKLSNAVITVQVGEKNATATGNWNSKSTVRTEIVAMRDGEPSVVRLTWESDDRVFEMKLQGQQQPNKNEQKGPLIGETVLLEMQNGQTRKTLMGKQPTTEQQAALDEQNFTNPDDIYPKEKVVPGYSWEVKDQHLAHFLPTALSIKGDALCTFEKVEAHRGQKCAVITLSINASFKVLFNGQEAEVEFGGHSTAYRSLDKLIDLETVMDGQMAITVAQILNGQRVNLKVAGPMRSEVHNREITDEP